MKKNTRTLLGYLLALAVLVGAIALFYRGTVNQKEKTTEADFIAALAKGDVATYTPNAEQGNMGIFQFFHRLVPQQKPGAGIAVHSLPSFAFS